MGFPIPLELLSLICSHLFHKDGWLPGLQDRGYRWNIQSFRLVCKDFAAAGSQFLTSTVYLTQYHHDLDVLTKISQHPYIKKHIRTMICDNSCLSSYQQTFDLKSSSQGAYCNRMYDEQRRIRCQGDDLAVFCAALTRFPNLRSIKVTDDCNILRNSYNTPVRETASWKANLLWPIPWSEKAPSTDVWDQASSPHHTFVTVVRALSIMGHEIPELYIEGRYFGISHRIFHASPEDFKHLCNVFRSLRKLGLAINTHEEDLWENKTLFSGLLRSIFSSANSLESLKLDSVLNEDKFYRIPVFSLSEGLGTRIWPCLRHFSLNQFQLDSYHDLTEFCIRHRATLQEVELSCIELEHTTWIEAFAKLRKSSITWDRCITDQLFDGSMVYNVPGSLIVQYLRAGGNSPFSDPKYRY
jgi:hypothetical protein